MDNNVVVYNDNVKRLTMEIKVYQDNICQGMVEIGKRLAQVKEEIPGEFENYIKTELNYSRTTAYNLIKVANEFEDVQTFGHVSSSKVFALLSIPAEAREDFTQSTPVEDITVRELKAEISKYKEENNLLTDKQKKALEEKKRLEAELEQEKSKPVETVIEKEIIIDNTDHKRVKELEARLEWFIDVAPDKYIVDMSNMSIEEIMADTKTVKEVSKISELKYIKDDIETACSKVSLIEYKIDLSDSKAGREVDLLLDGLIDQITNAKRIIKEKSGIPTETPTTVEYVSDNLVAEKDKRIAELEAKVKALEEQVETQEVVNQNRDDGKIFAIESLEKFIRHQGFFINALTEEEYKVGMELAEEGMEVDRALEDEDYIPTITGYYAFEELKGRTVKCKFSDGYYLADFYKSPLNHETIYDVHSLRVDEELAECLKRQKESIENKGKKKDKTKSK